jgi:predicted nucleic acid-binding protein
VSYALDTNLLTRSIQEEHPQRDEARTAIKKLLLADEEVFILPQNLIEFWAVATRPLDVEGLGLPANETAAHLAKFEILFSLKEDTPAIYLEWKKLVSQHAVMGRNVHDARIAAALTVHGVSHLVTFNKKHFKRFPAITALLPSEL